jgi:hypothetical protein
MVVRIVPLAVVYFLFYDYYIVGPSAIIMGSVDDWGCVVISAMVRAVTVVVAAIGMNLAAS